jgi:hypothetical protein
MIDWLSIFPTSGVSPGNGWTDDIEIIFIANNLENGEYAANILISSNDPDEGEIVVPVSLMVNELLQCTDMFNFNISTLQAFYFFENVLDINLNPVDADDWVLAFKGDLLVGARQWNTQACSSGICEVHA